MQKLNQVNLLLQLLCVLFSFCLAKKDDSLVDQTEVLELNEKTLD